MAGLTLKQQRFADEYIISGNATQSYLNAGYKATKRTVAEANARKLLGNYSVKAYIEERLNDLKSKKVADQQEIMELLTRVARGESRAATLIGLGGGAEEISQEMPPTMQERIKAAELLGKRYSMWTDKQEVSGTVGVVQIIDDIPGGPDD